MLMERVAGCWWNDWPDVGGTRGRMAWNTQNGFTNTQQQALEKAFVQHVNNIWAFAAELHKDASSCNTGGSCVYGKRFHLTMVEPKGENYELMGNLAYNTTFQDWALRCNKVHPGCADDWRARVEPVLARVRNGTASPDKVSSP